jgi:protein-disulfide isomerase
MVKMGKRKEIRSRRQRERVRRRILIILLVAGTALLVVFALILPGMREATGASSTKETPIVVITPRAIDAPVSGTSLGELNAPVKMDVWEDFQCSGCTYYSTNIEPQIIQAFIQTGKIYYTFHFMPFIDGGAGESHQAANAAMCASEQGRFWDYHEMLFANWTGENVGDYTDQRLVAFAERLGFDMAAFNKCFDANVYAGQINQDAQAGSKIGVPPTPGIFINGQKVVSSQGEKYIPSFEDISNAIDSALLGK